MKTTLLIIGTLAFNLCVNAQVCFDPSTTFPFLPGSNPASATSADFNGDGKADLAVANSGRSEVVVLLGNGSGGFLSIVVSFTVGSSPVSVISADFNGDGKADLATANSYSNNVSVLLGDGSGGFNTAVGFSVGSNPISLLSADFNGDGRTDLATANNGSQNVSVLLGNGAGSFAAAVNFAAAGFPSSITSADFNGDGKTDLATANLYHNTVSVLSGNGAGSFAAAVNVSVAGSPSSVTSADFNGDGKADLATTNLQANTIAVLPGNGAGNFAPPVYLAVRNSPVSITSADVNADGKADLALGSANANSDTLFVLPGDGTGSFAAPLSFIVGKNPYAVISADFNGDGKTDLVTTNYNVGSISLVLNCVVTGIGTFANEQQIRIYPNPAGTTVQVALVGSGLLPSIDDNSVIQLTDMLGRTVRQPILLNDQTHATIDVSNLCNGVYFVNVRTTAGMITKKMIVSR